MCQVFAHRVTYYLNTVLIVFKMSVEKVYFHWFRGSVLFGTPVRVRNSQSRPRIILAWRWRCRWYCTCLLGELYHVLYHQWYLETASICSPILSLQLFGLKLSLLEQCTLLFPTLQSFPGTHQRQSAQSIVSGALKTFSSPHGPRLATNP